MRRHPATSRFRPCLSQFRFRGSGLLRGWSVFPLSSRWLCTVPFPRSLNCPREQSSPRRGSGTSPLVGSNGLEPSTSRLSGVRSNHLSYEPIYVAGRFHRPNPLLRLCAESPSVPATGGDEQNRTVDPLLARQVLSQLSYAPISGLSLLDESTLFEFPEGPSKLNSAD